MAGNEKSSRHEWANTVIAVAAFVAAGASALFAWQANRLHDESIQLSVRPHANCMMQYELSMEGTPPFVALCWDVLITNRSEDKAVVTDLTITNDDGEKIWNAAEFVPIGWFETTEGERINNKLISIEGGSAELIVAHMPNPLTKESSQKMQSTTHEERGSLGLEEAVRDLLNLPHQPIVHPLPRLCDVMNDVDSNGQCRVHYTIKAKTARGTVVVVKTGMPLWR